MTKVDWKDSQLLRQMPKDIDLLLEEGDINHLNNVLLDDKNDFKFSTNWEFYTLIYRWLWKAVIVLTYI